MSILSKSEMQDLLKIPGEELDSLVVTPPPPEDAFDDDSFDIRLGQYFASVRQTSVPFVTLGQTPLDTIQQRLFVPFNHRIILQPHSSILGITLEYIKLPFNVSAQVLTKSSWGRYYLTIATATYVHAGFRGCLTLEILNSSNTAIELKPGCRIGQMILFRVPGLEKPLKHMIRGRFAGTVYPEFPQ